MRFLLYNIRYCSGYGRRFHVPLPFSGYLKNTSRNLKLIAAFITSMKPDIVGLIEVDSGSFRSKQHNQAAVIARELNHFHIYQSKYCSTSLVGRLPLFRKQGNAFLTSSNIKGQQFHYFHDGVKRLVIELELEEFVIFLVHLSIKFRHRQYQLRDLYTLVKPLKKPAIIAGDFNAFWGDHELQLFLAATGLANANRDALPTYPSRHPRKQFDFILHSPDIHIKQFAIPRVTYSDHMPLVCNFEVGAPARPKRS